MDKDIKFPSNKPNNVTISVLEYPENIRLRKEMYLMNPNHCIEEIIDNAIDEYSAGFCNQINIIVNKDTNTVTVKDNGRGIPTENSTLSKYKNISQLELSMTTIHAGGKFSDSRKNSYKSITSGLHGKLMPCLKS